MTISNMAYWTERRRYMRKLKLLREDERKTTADCARTGFVITDHWRLRAIEDLRQQLYWLRRAYWGGIDG